MDKKFILVTGGAGFIGKHTVTELKKNNFDVIVADIKDQPEDLDCKYYKLDVASKDIYKIFEGNNIEYVIHLAALPSVAASIKDPLLDCHANYQATVNVCNAAQKYKCKKIVFSSTAAVYANPQYLPVDEKHPVSFLSPYAITKYASENFVQYCGIDYIVLRYANVYGIGQDATGEAGVVAKFFDNIKQNLPVQIHGNGEQYRDFINVKDVAKVNILALQSNVKNEIINVSTNSQTSINNLFQILKEEFAYKLDPEHIPTREGDIEKSILSNKKLLSLFNYQPSIDLQHGINEMVGYLHQKTYI